MSDDARILELVDEILESSRAPEDVCRNAPDLLPLVRQRLERVRAVKAELDEFFTAEPSAYAIGDLPATPPNVPGYEILEPLGHGGMGIVYKARQLKANRLVALKMILQRALATPEQKRRFQIEIESVARF